MLLIFSRLGRYLYTETAKGLALMLGIVATLIILVDFVEESRTVGARVEGISPFTLLKLTLLKTPMLVETSLPFIILFGTMFALFRLNRSSELIVMRAAGLSAWRFLTPPLTIAIVTGILGATALNPVAASMNARFEKTRAELVAGASETGASVTSDGRMWMRGGDRQRQTLIRALGANTMQSRLIEPTFFFFEPGRDGEMAFAERIDAESARLQAGFWQLEGAVGSAPGARPRILNSVSFPASIDVDSVFRREAQARSLSLWTLPSTIRAAEQSGFPATDFELRFYSLLILPLMLAAMALIAAAASLRLTRLGGAMPLAVLGGGAGFLLFFLDDLVAAFAENGNLHAAVAAAATPAAATLLAIALIAQIEDG